MADESGSAAPAIVHGAVQQQQLRPTVPGNAHRVRPVSPIVSRSGAGLVQHRHGSAASSFSPVTEDMAGIPVVGGDTSRVNDVDDGEAKRQVLQGRDKLLIAALSAQYALNGGVQTGLFPATLSAVQAAFGVSHTGMSALVAIYDAFQMLTSLVVPHFSEQHGMHGIIQLGAFVCAIGTVVYGLATGYWMLVVSQVFNGVGSACLIVLCPPILNKALACKGKGAFYLSVVYGVCSVGVVVAYVAAGVSGPAESWRVLFLICGALFVLPASIFQRLRLTPVARSGVGSPTTTGGIHNGASTSTTAGAFPRAEFESHERESIDGLASTPGGLPLSETLGGRRDRESLESVFGAWKVEIDSAMRQLRVVASNQVVVFTILAQSAVSFYMSAFIAFLPKFVEVQLGMGESVASAIVAMTIPAATAGMVTSGHLINSKAVTVGYLLRVNAYSALLSIPLCFIFYITTVWLFAIILVVDMMLIFFSCVPSIAVFAHVLSEEHAPFANGLCNFTIRLLGSVPGPLVLGVLLDSPSLISPQAAYLTVGLLGSVAAAACALLALERHTESIQESL